MIPSGRTASVASGAAFSSSSASRRFTSRPRTSAQKKSAPRADGDRNAGEPFRRRVDAAQQYDRERGQRRAAQRPARPAAIRQPARRPVPQGEDEQHGRGHREVKAVMHQADVQKDLGHHQQGEERECDRQRESAALGGVRLPIPEDGARGQHGQHRQRQRPQGVGRGHAVKIPDEHEQHAGKASRGDAQLRRARAPGEHPQAGRHAEHHGVPENDRQQHADMLKRHRWCPSSSHRTAATRSRSRTSTSTPPGCRPRRRRRA